MNDSSPFLGPLHDHAEGRLYFKLTEAQTHLYQSLEQKRIELHFPSLKLDVGQFCAWLAGIKQPKKIFEFGSGFGFSAFWFLLGTDSGQTKIILTERRTDLLEVFKNLPWIEGWIGQMCYHQGDAWEILPQHLDSDLFLVDGEKGQYHLFLKALEGKVKKGTIVIVDNSHHKGLGYLPPEEVSLTETSKKNLYEFHQYLTDQKGWKISFVPFRDGVILLESV